MTKHAFLTGYTGKRTRTPAQLLQLAINLDAVVVDSRYAPRSRVPHWGLPALEQLLGDRYLYVSRFGNEGYRSGYIKIADPALGLTIINDAGITRAIILCACADGATCHRKQVGEYLAANGWVVREVTKEEWEEAR